MPHEPQPGHQQRRQRTSSRFHGGRRPGRAGRHRRAPDDGGDRSGHPWRARDGRVPRVGPGAVRARPPHLAARRARAGRRPRALGVRRGVPAAARRRAGRAAAAEHRDGQRVVHHPRPHGHLDPAGRPPAAACARRSSPPPTPCAWAPGPGRSGWCPRGRRRSCGCRTARCSAWQPRPRPRPHLP
nr:hypothetical protein [Angustibacter aerolatus]